jgi:hypothetical protein
MLPEQRFHQGGDTAVAHRAGIGWVERYLVGLHTR